MKTKDPRNIISGISGLFKLDSLIKSTGRKFILPFYHAITDKPGPHLRHLYPIKSEKEFIKDIDALLRYFDPLSPEVLLKNRESLDKTPGFILSFDDGLREVYEIIAGILKEKGIPAIFFLNNSFIDNKDLFYRYKASLIIDNIKKKGLSKGSIYRLSKISGRRITTQEKLFRYILNLKYHDRHVLDKFCDILEIDIVTFLRKNKPYMNFEEIEELKRKGFFIGAHSFDHPEFYDLAPARQEESILESILDVRRRFKVDYSFFAFPFTDHGTDKLVLESVHSVDEIKPMVSFGTAGLKPALDMIHYQRISMEKYRGDSEKILKTEYLYFKIKKMAGR